MFKRVSVASSLSGLQSSRSQLLSQAAVLCADDPRGDILTTIARSLAAESPGSPEDLCVFLTSNPDLKSLMFVFLSSSQFLQEILSLDSQTKELNLPFIRNLFETFDSADCFRGIYDVRSDLAQFLTDYVWVNRDKPIYLAGVKELVSELPLLGKEAVLASIANYQHEFQSAQRLASIQSKVDSTESFLQQSESDLVPLRRKVQGQWSLLVSSFGSMPSDLAQHSLVQTCRAFHLNVDMNTSEPLLRLDKEGLAQLLRAFTFANGRKPHPYGDFGVYKSDGRDHTDRLPVVQVEGKLLILPFIENPTHHEGDYRKLVMQSVGRLFSPKVEISFPNFSKAVPLGTLAQPLAIVPSKKSFASFLPASGGVTLDVLHHNAKAAKDHAGANRLQAEMSRVNGHCFAVVKLIQDLNLGVSVSLSMAPGNASTHTSPELVVSKENYDRLLKLEKILLSSVLSQERSTAASQYLSGVLAYWRQEYGPIFESAREMDRSFEPLSSLS